MRTRSLAVALLVFALVFALPALAFGADTTGEATLKENPGAPVDYVWILVAAFLVYFMQAGFALVESGFCRAKNVTNLMMKNMMDFVMGSLAFLAVGFAFMFGEGSPFIGLSGWFLRGESYDVNQYLLFMFQVVFAATAATIVSGAVAERLKFSAYLMYSIVVSAFIYPIYGHWVWGPDGWLGALQFGAGFKDFAGSGVVHTIGAMVGLAGTIVLGPRFGKYGKDGKPRPIPGHNMAFAAIGCFILWFGWFGFNPGSTFGAHDLRIAVIAVNTNIAAAAGAAVGLLTIYAKTRKFDLGMTINGALGGLVAVTAGCAYFDAVSSLIVGVVAGAIVVIAALTIESLGVDDPVGAVAVHGIGGVWGLLAVGLFADGSYDVRGLFFGGGADQLVAQAIGAGVAVAWAFGLGFALFKVMDLVYGIRVPAEEELAGLDVGEHGAQAYPNFLTLEEPLDVHDIDGTTVPMRTTKEVA